MDNHQLEGRLLLYPGTDVISLIHEVHGRTSEMILTKADLITVLDKEGEQSIKVDDLYDIPRPGSTRSRFIENAAYRFQGARVVVTLSTRGTLTQNSAFIKRYVKLILDYVRSKYITYEEAEKLINQIEDIGSSFD